MTFKGIAPISSRITLNTSIFMVARESFNVDDHNISALSAGNPSHPVALFLHGIPAAAELWRDILPAVADRGWYCLAPDCPGYGYTVVGRSGGYSISDTADLLIRWIGRNNWRDIWLIGHDIGGGIAQLLMTRAGDRFQKVTLSNCATADTWPVPIINALIFTARMGLFPLAARLGLAQAIGTSSLKSAFGHPRQLTKDMKERIFFDRKMQEPAGRNQFAAMLKALGNQATVDNMQALKNASMPVHLVWGMKDPNQPWHKTGIILEQVLSNLRVTQLPKAGHFLQLDQPNQYLEALLG